MTKAKNKALAKRTQTHTALRADETALIKKLTSVQFGFLRAADVWRAVLDKVEEEAALLDKGDERALHRVTVAAGYYREQLQKPVTHHTCVNLAGPMPRQLAMTRDIFPVRGRIGAGSLLAHALWLFAVSVGAVDMPPTAQAPAPRPTAQPASLFD